jgi:hypothetical protein
VRDVERTRSHAPIEDEVLAMGIFPFPACIEDRGRFRRAADTILSPTEGSEGSFDIHSPGKGPPPAKLRI